MKERKRKTRIFKTNNSNKSLSKYQELLYAFSALNVNGIKFPIKRQGLADYLKQMTKTNGSALFCVYETHIPGKAIHGSEVKLKLYYKQIKCECGQVQQYSHPTKHILC